eukprot:GFYU01013778.1.p1 GENE.GFYU01013778.1~~GFYU01013778.1.p1  ORF type:complete len:236 (+),score=41.16 GFYU01013778.1:50-709(+)
MSLPVYKSPADISTLFENTGLRLVFVRHSKTTKPVDQTMAADSARVLTEEGKELCGKHREAWFSKASVYGRISSVATRCQDTCKMMSGDDSVPIALVESIYMQIHEEAAADIFNRLSYAPLETYLKDAAGPKVFQTYVDNVLPNVVAEVKTLLGQSQAAGNKETTIAVFGHAIFSGSMAATVCKALGMDEIKYSEVLTFTHGECEGIAITADGVTIMKL